MDRKPGITIVYPAGPDVKYAFWRVESYETNGSFYAVFSTKSKEKAIKVSNDWVEKGIVPEHML